MPEKNILICDDELGIRESLNLILSDAFKITFAENGIEAIEQISKNSFDAMLLDIKMPKINGLETLKEIKKINPTLPIIIVTGYQSAEVAKEALKQGAFAYLPKPFESADILKTVSDAISSRRD